jgi:hypothetical protein
MQMFPVFSAEIARIKADELLRLSGRNQGPAQLRPVRRRRPRRRLQVADPLAAMLIGVRLASPADERASR